MTPCPACAVAHPRDVTCPLPPAARRIAPARSLDRVERRRVREVRVEHGLTASWGGAIRRRAAVAVDW